MATLSSDCDPACVGCMGSGPARCRKCASGYTLTGSKCLGNCLKRDYVLSIISSACIHYVLLGSCSDLQVSDEMISLFFLDIDECSDRVLACHGLDEICTNTEGSFRCDCAEGFIHRDGVCVKKQQPGESHHTHNHVNTLPHCNLSHVYLPLQVFRKKVYLRIFRMTRWRCCSR